MNKATTTTVILALTLLGGCGGSADEESQMQTELSMSTLDRGHAKSASEALHNALTICTTNRA